MVNLVVAIDTETTGVDVTKDRIIEIAIVACDIDTGKILIRYEQKFNPEMHIGVKASAIHDLTDADVITCPTFASKAATISALLAKASLILAHNGEDFDSPLIMNEMKRVAQPYPENLHTFDTMREGRWATADGKFPTLGELAWSLGVPYDKTLAHRALYDTEIMLECYLKAVNAGIWQANNKLLLT